jgi:hypothetical protein
MHASVHETGEPRLLVLSLSQGDVLSLLCSAASITAGGNRMIIRCYRCLIRKWSAFR